MSKFLTPPVWYDSKGNLVEILAKAKSNEGTNDTAPGAGVGVNADAGNGSTAIGTNASAPNNLSVAIGYDAKDSGSGSVAVGMGSTASGGYSVSVGLGATASGGHSVAIGGAFIDENEGSQTPTTAAGSAVAIGCGADASSFGDIAIGERTTSNSKSDEHNQVGAIVIGYRSWVYGENSIVIGTGINVGNYLNPVNNTIQIGNPSIPGGYTFLVGYRNVFDEIADNASKAAAAANTFSINDTPYKATYDPASATLNFITT